MKRVRQCSRALLIALLFGVGLVAVGLVFPCCSLLPGRRGTVCRDFIQVAWYRSLGKVLGVRVRRFGRIADEATMWAGNHISWLDIVVLGAQRPLTFVAKIEVGSWPIVGFMARGTGTLLVKRGDAASSGRTAEAMVWMMRQNRRLMVFPEGTSSSGERVLRFHSRLFQPSTLIGGTVQAVALAYRGEACKAAPFVGDDAFLPHLWAILAVPSIEVDLTFCEPLTSLSKSRDQLAQTAFQQVCSAIGCALPPKGESPRREDLRSGRQRVNA